MTPAAQIATALFAACALAMAGMVVGMATEREAWRAKGPQCVNMILTVPGAGIFRADGAKVLELGR